MTTLTRRGILAGLGLLAADSAFAQTAVSPRPRARPAPGRPTPVVVDIGAASEALLTRVGLSGEVAFAVADAASGVLLASHGGDTPLPPASVAKALTTAYAFDVLGPGHRFETRVLARGAVRDGRLEGDLILAGGGAPGLSTSGLAKLASQLKDIGLREVTGRFLIWEGALPHLSEIDPKQPAHLGYNPSVSGLNLNYNRVHFDWKRKGENFVLLMDARDGPYVPPVARIGMKIEDRSLPVFEYGVDAATGRELWSVSRRALGTGGARWLPVRDSALYAAEVFATLARAEGLVLPPPLLSEQPPVGAVLATLVSPPLDEIARDMLKYSTNLTAEVLGLSATMARRGGLLPVDLKDSADEMNLWAAERFGMTSTHLVDHSGLGDASRVTAEDYLRLLVRLGPDGALRQVLYEISLQQKSGKPELFKLSAKTGTLNFVSGLAGFITPEGRNDLVFAIFTADFAQRSAIPPGGEENPPGSKAWTRRSRAMQYDLVRLWSKAS